MEFCTSHVTFGAVIGGAEGASSSSSCRDVLESFWFIERLGIWGESDSPHNWFKKP